MTQEQVIRRTTKNEHGTVTLVIPAQFREECDLAEPTNIIITKQDSGLFIKKLRIDNNE